MSSPSIPPPVYFQDGDVMVGRYEENSASSMSCWDFDLKDPGPIIAGSELSCLDGGKPGVQLQMLCHRYIFLRLISALPAGEEFLREDSDPFKFLSIPTGLPSSSDISPQPDASRFLENTANFNSIAPVHEPSCEEKSENPNKERQTPLEPLLPYDASQQDASHSQPAGGAYHDSQKYEESLNGGRDALSVLTSGWDGRTVSPKDAFLDYDHVYTKLEDEATRRASQSWIQNSVITTHQNPSIGNLPESLHHLADETFLSSDLFPSSNPNQALTSDTLKQSYSRNTSSGRRVLKSPGEFPASQFSLPPQCVPKNAIRWTHYTTGPASPSKLQINPLSIGRKSAPGEKSHSFVPKLVSQDEIQASAHDSLVNLGAGDVPTSHPTELLTGEPTRVALNCEEFSASSEEETSTLETEATASRFDEHNERSITNSLALQTDIHCGPHPCETLHLSSGIDYSKKESGRSKSTRCNRLDALTNDYANNSHLTSSNHPQLAVENSPKQLPDLSCFPSKSPVEKANFHQVFQSEEAPSKSVASVDSLEGSTTDFILTIDDESSQEREFCNPSPVALQKHTHTICTRQASQEPSKCDPVKAGDYVRKGRRAASNNYHSSPSYSRVTRSAIGRSSGKITDSTQNSTAPVSPSGRGSRKASSRRAQGGGSLSASCRSLSHTLGSASYESTGHTYPTGPIMCGHVDEKTGEKCETMFRRPYDLARHKETIHDSEGPGGDRKPQWKCGKPLRFSYCLTCHGEVNQLLSCFRHCRTRNH
ncbi:hypothetical protein VP01_3055g3 [Puccinia sorghi]|uniref:C2H2-type domain-containing protein n=1 Tax=Puccinia sorghi TaxID=27349 RepID=A0A0L6UZW8_9BASI|nr:hypothetical protein VP01_3055g3 [Puccinia sorghi]